MVPERKKALKLRAVAALITATVLTIPVVLLVGRQYEASTVFGPTDQAMRNALSSGNEGAAPELNNEARMGESRRIAWGASNATTVSRAVYYLASAGNLRQALQLEGLDSPMGPDFEKAQTAVRDRIDELDFQDRPQRTIPLVVPTWDPETADKESAIYAIYQRSGLPPALWADFVYLDLLIEHFNISREPLRLERISETVAGLVKKVTPEIGSPRDVVLNVRHRDPRMAEILANAVTAVYKNQYDTDNLKGLRKQLVFFRQRQLEAARSYSQARRAYARWMDDNRGIDLDRPSAASVEARSMEGAFKATSEALSEANRKFRRAEEEFRRSDADGALRVSSWAGLPPGTPDRPVSPAREARSEGLFGHVLKVFLFWFASSFLVLSAAAKYSRDVAAARNRPEDGPPAEAREAVGVDSDTF